MVKKKITLKSMTGFGSSSQQTTFGRFDIEIQSVNRRHLEIVFSLPKQLNRLESELRAWLSSRVGRGQISCSVYWKKSPNKAVSVTPNIELGKAMKKALEQLAKTLKVDSKVTLEMLNREKEILSFEEGVDEKKITMHVLEKGLSAAFDQFEKIKEDEGLALAADFKKRLAQLKKWIDKIKSLSKEATQHHRQKLLTRLEEVLGKSVENDERILKEIALYAEKIDIEEEVVRFNSHLNQMNEMVETTLSSKTDAKGKRIEFLLQELLRECNTIGSKASHATVAATVVDIKCELERLREQVQNVE